MDSLFVFSRFLSASARLRNREWRRFQGAGREYVGGQNKMKSRTDVEQLSHRLWTLSFSCGILFVRSSLNILETVGVRYGASSAGQVVLAQQRPDCKLILLMHNPVA